MAFGLVVRSHEFLNLWNLQVFVRNPHPSLREMLTSHIVTSGIYLIGCDGEIVYIGQSNDILRRPLQSLGKAYHQVSDTSLQWSLALAPGERDDLDELESSAIRAFAPRFNTSIPSVAKSEGRLPQITAMAPVFQLPDRPCGACNPQNLKQQMERAAADPSPPWRRKRTRRPSAPVPKAPYVPPEEIPELTEEEHAALLADYGVPADGDLVYPINMCRDGLVVTRDGEVLGIWALDKFHCPSFTPDGAAEPLMHHVTTGGLAFQIRQWYEKLEDRST